MFENAPHAKIIHILACVPNISPIEPATTTDGMAETRPEKKRPMITPVICGTVLVTIQNPL
jgi:hypothetical protein